MSRHFSVIQQKGMIESRGVRESARMRSSTLLPRVSLNVCEIENPTSNALAIAYGSRASTERVTCLYFADDHVVRVQL